ncbi:MAG: hypothetical protein LBS33_02425 [Streptococcaceae bacterium]|jgi:cysteinyl-tRNA synthetase|nr:hypothetical protein [Streptococcaceae bacterium]
MTKKEEYQKTLELLLDCVLQGNYQSADKYRQKLRELGIELIEINEKADNK